MSQTNIRQTKAPKRGKADPKKFKTARRIPITQLRTGMKIVTAWAGQKVPDEITEEEALAVLSGQMEMPEQSRFVVKSSKVDEVSECPGKSRTHVHVNKRDCYDIRFSYIWVVNE